MKTVRFSQVVSQCGQPELYTLWSEPEKDKRFQSALKQHRVMTVHQETVGSKKDYGEAGFTEDKQGSLLVFPKSLKQFEGRRVIGVKYDLLTSSPPSHPIPIIAKPVKKPPQPPGFSKIELFRAMPYKAASSKPSLAAKPSKKKEDNDDNAARDLDLLTRAVRRAMKELQNGKSVAAYQTLEKAISS